MLRRPGINPLWQKSFRSRLRPKHLISWGVVTVTVTAFVSMIIYATMTEQEMATPEVAAKAVLPGVIVIQAVILMMMGTGAVAAGVSRERDEGLLDYQRMTPMGPTAKILGYLFGLPVREYILFAMTLPFVVVAVWISGFSLLTLVHFYAVFFTSVWVYHMTALVAGMVAPKARTATMLSMGLVVALYFILPHLSRVGITFFEFLTIRPTFFGIIWQELPAEYQAPAGAGGIDSFRVVPFFAGAIHPTWYTMLVQGFVLAVMFSIVHRRWRYEFHHIMSKVGSVAVFGGVVFFVLASVWAIIVQEDAYRQVFGAFDDEFDLRGARSPESFEALLILSMLILGITYVGVVTAITPSRDRTVEGWRRARKLGSGRLGFNSDAASSFPAAVLMLAITIGAGVTVLRHADGGAGYYAEGPPMGARLMLAVSILAVGLFIQGMRERLGLRMYSVMLFLLWMVPFFAMMIMYVAFEAFVPGTYVGLPCPPVLIGYEIAEMMQQATPLEGMTPQLVPEPLEDDLGAITMVGTVGYAAAAVFIQAMRVRYRRRLRAPA